MPFINLNKEDTLPAGEFDTTIIGAGAAGIFLAVKLSKAGKKILLIESGHYTIDEEKQKLNEVVQTAKFLNNSEWGRKRAIGGSTLAWGGQSLPFSKFDFIKRSWINNSGWPIESEELSEYYHEANAFMGVDSLNYSDDIFRKIKLENPGFNAALLDYHVAKWAPEPDFQKLYKNYLKIHVTVLFNAQLNEIIKSDDRIESVNIINFNKRLFNIKINSLIIAAGGIESVRILLNNGIGNHSNWLGKCFMEHPCVDLGKIVSTDNFRLQRFFNTHVFNGKKYSIRLSLSPKFQENNKTLNCSGSVMFMPSDELFDVYAEIKKFKKDLQPKRLLSLFKNLNKLRQSFKAYLKYKFIFKNNAVGRLILMSEQEPLCESTITLSDTIDIFKTRRACINWELSDKSWHTIIKTAEVLKSEIERLNFGKVELSENISDNKSNWKDFLSDVNHHMGGTRMSADKMNGVVNKDLQVWEIQNLFICSCSVFPTCSHSNPTLTLLALCARLSKKLTDK